MEEATQKLKQATRDEVLFSLEYAMKFRHGKSTRAAQDVAVGALASMVLEHLEISGFVFMKRPPRPPHSTPRSGIPMKE